MDIEHKPINEIIIPNTNQDWIQQKQQNAKKILSKNL